MTTPYTPTSTPPAWSETHLWKELTNRSDPSLPRLCSDLTSILTDVTTVLLYGGTAPPDFTLHDSGHAFRVAERMASLPGLTEIQALSSSELALLLLSAYLHDVGMTPERRQVSNHYEYLLTAAPDLLREEECVALQAWLDEFHPGMIAPIAKRIPPTPKDLRTASELVTYYCRFKHVEWGEAWIKSNLAGRPLGKYTAWCDDLCRLCASHHQGFEELNQPSFNPRFVATSGDIVHLRYLACALRLADILEFDPERTPTVLLQHRAINPQSLVYWWRDKEISFYTDGIRMLLSARPTSAYIHRALLELADAIDYELRLCRRLTDDHPFNAGPSGLHLPHKWALPLGLHLDIRPRNDEYEYLDATFRPDTERLLTLLSGTQLYGSPLTAIREMAQNAFDAVKEAITYKRLAEDNPADEKWDDILGRLHKVTLGFEKRKDGWWLKCSDTGVGMSKSHIRDALLVSGRAQRPDVLALERRAQAQRVSLNRTGQFGIGVLSYFMLGDHLVFETRRSQIAEPQESTGWTFETDGIGSFGQLTANRACPPGTTVSLRLREGIISEEDPSEWINSAIEYITTAVVRSPCRFVILVELNERYSCEPGWTLTRHDLVKLTTRSISHWIGDRGTGEAFDPVPDEAAKRLQGTLGFAVDEGFLPEGCGRYRMHLPYFALDGGDSLGWLWIARDSKPERLARISHSAHVLLPTTGSIQSWKGMMIRNPKDSSARLDTHWWHAPGTYDPEHDLGTIIELDWTSSKAGTLAVNRQQLENSDVGKTHSAGFIIGRSR